MMRGKIRWPHVAASAIAIGWAAPPARAFDRFWQAFLSGDFTDTSKWLGGAVPGAGDNAIFRVFGGTPAPYTITFPGHSIIQGPANYVNDTLKIGPNTVTFLQSTQPDLTPSTYTLSTMIQIGEGTGPSSLSSSLSQLSTPITSIGYIAGSAGTLSINGGVFNVTGSGSPFELAVGDSANGTLNLNAGAQINVNGAEGNAVVGGNAGISGIVNVTGAGAIWNNTSSSLVAPLVVGELGSGTMTISAGGQVNNPDGIIANQAGSSGNVTVTGAGSLWANRNSLTVGQYGTATLTVSNGGQVTCDSANIGAQAGATGKVQITGAGSQWNQTSDLNVGGIVIFNGSSGAGVMTLTAGGNVTTGGNGTIGSTGSGGVSVSDPGSKWTVGKLLQIYDVGMLNLANGGSVVSNTAVVAGVANIKSSSILSVSDYLQVSEGSIFATNSGTVNVNSGGQVNSRVAFVAGGSFAGLGQVNLDGVGSAWNTSDQLYVGFLGKGVFQVTAGGKVTNGECQLGVGNQSVGIISVDGSGSTWTTTQNMDVGVVGTGDLIAAHGGVVTVNGPFSIGPNGTIEGNSIIAADVRNEGTTAPGISSSLVHADLFATLQINGNYTQTSAGKLKIDLNTPADHDLLRITGDAALAGALELDKGAGFVSNPGDRFTILTAAHRTGVFDATASLGGGGIFLVPIYSPTDVVILVASTSEKTWGIDANGNSSVPGNWIRGAPGAVDDKVAFSTVITADRTVTVDSSFTAGSIYFDGSKNYLVQGPGAITLDVSTGSALLAVKNLHGAGTHTIAAPLTFNDNTTIDIAPSTTLRITQQMTAAPGVALTKTSAGTLAVKNIRADGLSIAGGTVQVLPGGGAGGTSLLKSLTIASSSRLDLNNNDLLIDYSGSSPYTTIRDYLLAGLNTGTGGIVSSTGQVSGKTIHAIVDNAHLHKTSWNGIIIDDSTIIAKYTLRGDANLDATVGFADLVAVAQNYGKTGQTWDTGDFNYDGNVNFADLVAVAQNYGTALPAGPIPGASPDFERDLPAAFASVPEPSIPAAFALLACTFTRRTRKRKPQARLRK